MSDDLRERIGSALDVITPSPAPVAAVMRKGKALRRRRRFAVAAICAAIVVAAAVLPGLVGGGNQPQQHHSKVVRWKTLCQVTAPPSLQLQLRITVPISVRSDLVPFGTEQNSKLIYASLYTRTFSGVAVVNSATGAFTRIRAYPDGASGQANGASDGRWLVWFETSRQNPDNFTVFSWDSQTTTLRVLGHSIPGPHGPQPSQWQAPAIAGNYAAWAQGTGAGGRSEVVLADLLTGKVTILRRGFAQAPFFYAGLVAWPEADRLRGPATMRAVNIPSGTPALLPAALRRISNASVIAANGTAIAYLSPDLAKLYYSPSQGKAPRLILSLPAGVTFSPPITIGSGWLAWTTSTATFVASTATGGFAQVTPQYGGATGTLGGSSHIVLVSDYAGKSLLPLHVVDMRAVTWPKCPPANQR